MITCEQLSAEEIVGRLCPTIPQTIHDATKFTADKDYHAANVPRKRYLRKLRECGITLSSTV